MKTLAIVGFVAALAASPMARAHGGLPISQQILRQNSGATMFIPVVYWGIWVGDGTSPWEWICEEAINPYQMRTIALSADGTFYASDLEGLTTSSQAGCEWTTVADPTLAKRHVAAIATDPIDGATAYVATSNGAITDADGGTTDPGNGLFVTRDHGATFARAPALSGDGRAFTSVRVAPSDGKTLYVVSRSLMPPFTFTLHRSVDGGTSFTEVPIGYTLQQQAPSDLDLVGIDPRDTNTVFARATVLVPGPSGDMVPKQSLLHSFDGGATFAELYVVDSRLASGGLRQGINGIAVDAAHARLFVSALDGVHVAPAPVSAAIGTLQPVTALSTSQCVDVHDDELFVCSTNFMPDFAALAKSTDDGQSINTILRYADTHGPVSCPAGTRVGDICPGVWTAYATQLGIETMPDMGTSPPPKSSGGCDAAGAPAPLPAALWLFVAILAVASIAWRARQ